MPDYSFSGKGLRVDGVTADKPAAKAGLQRNDIVTKLGDWEINDINDYMSALGKFNKGDKTTISFIRGTEVMSSTIEF
jgi:S1-C subfamily serine protease